MYTTSTRRTKTGWVYFNKFGWSSVYLVSNLLHLKPQVNLETIQRDIEFNSFEFSMKLSNLTGFLFFIHTMKLVVLASNIFLQLILIRCSSWTLLGHASHWWLQLHTFGSSLEVFWEVVVHTLVLINLGRKWTLSWCWWLLLALQLHSFDMAW